MTFKKLLLSKEAIRMLENNSISYKERDKQIIFKRPYDFMGPFLFFFLYLLLAFPLSAISFRLSIGIFLGICVLAILHWSRFSRRAKLILNLGAKELIFKSAKINNIFPFHDIQDVVIYSVYNGSYASAFKKTNEEYVIRIGITTEAKEPIYLLRLIGDYQEPSSEMNEVVDLLNALIKHKKMPQS
ncbi:MAG: hypothetical protein AAF789_00575 [Bacteroidota bacterium]